MVWFEPVILTVRKKKNSREEWWGAERKRRMVCGLAGKSRRGWGFQIPPPPGYCLLELTISWLKTLLPGHRFLSAAATLS